MGFGRGKGFSPVPPVFPEGYTGPTELDLRNTWPGSWLRRYTGAETYIACHNANNATNVVIAGNRVVRQYQPAAGRIYIERHPMYFDTSAIPADAVITAAFVYQYISLHPVPVDIVIVNAPDLNEPPVLADYGYLRDQTTPLATLEVADQEDATRNFWYMNSAGLAAIVKGGTTRWGMRTITDINAVEPPGVNSEGISLSQHFLRLVVSYYVPT